MVKTAAQAEQYFTNDPPGALTKLRRLGELVAEAAAARLNVSNLRNNGRKVSQHILVERLDDAGALSPELVRLFTDLRKTGNAAVHEDAGTQRDALHQLEMAHKLALWLHLSFGDDEDFDPDPFVPPPPPANVHAALEAKLARMREELAKHETLLGKAEVMFAELDRSPTLSAKAEAKLEQAHEARIQQLLANAEAQTPEQRKQRLSAAQAAAAGLELNEDQTRELIDIQLRAAGWEVDSQVLRHARGARPVKGRNLAIAEWPTASGPADYILFRGLTPVAIVEAKREAKNVRGCLEQAKRYSRDFRLADTEGLTSPGGPWGEYQIPFLFATNGRPFLRQLIEESGVWFLDVREATNHRRPLDGWMTPAGLADLLTQDIAGATAKLDNESLDYLPLRHYQREAIRAIEAGIAAGKREILLAMATGTGKTRTCICLIYRLIKAGRFKRVLFLVDRTSLGDQAMGAFDNLKLEQQRPFTKIYDVKELGQKGPEGDTRLHIATIQAMVRRLDGDESDALALPVDQYDCIVIDECHRGYNLDREMSETERGYRSASDYVSKYRQVIDHFDAIKIGLTATPALHTTQIFGDPVYTYSYRQAVIDGYLVDHEPAVRITTALSQAGVHWDAGEAVEVYRAKQNKLDLIHTPDEIDIEVEGFNSKVLVPAFNRAVCRELAKHIDPALPGKTLIFCANDRHADDVVGLMLEAFEEVYGPTPDNAVVKITGAADKPAALIKRFKNERDPRVAVTVDLLTTGIDVPEIVNLVFLRRVRSRILYDQMIGRGTRLCDDIGKRYFRVFDAVKIYETLLDYTEMKPVVSDVTTSVAQLVEGLATLKDPEARTELCDQLLAKLQRKRRLMRGAKLDRFVELSGDGPLTLLNKMPSWDADVVLSWWQERPALIDWLDKLRGDGPVIPIHRGEDEVVDVEQGTDKPEDYLEGFKAFIADNLNEIPALTVVTQRPRDLTREQLKDLRLALAQHGYTEAGLETAWRKAKNQDIAASIIGFIRGQALGSPLVPYDKRVEAALVKILASRDWTRPQRKWLERIGKQLTKQRVIDRAILDEDPAFKEHGGFRQLDKRFGGELEGILRELNEAVWDDAG